MFLTVVKMRHCRHHISPVTCFEVAEIVLQRWAIMQCCPEHVSVVQE